MKVKIEFNLHELLEHLIDECDGRFGASIVRGIAKAFEEDPPIPMSKHRERVIEACDSAIKAHVRNMAERSRNCGSSPRCSLAAEMVQEFDAKDPE